MQRWVCRFTGRRGRQQQALHDLAVLQVRFDDLVDVGRSTKVYQVASG
jgi:hypothetical protein